MLAKRIFDLFLSITGIIILAPLFLVLVLWIKFDSRGPVFFRQVRVGKMGKSFSIFKFRTMVRDAERSGLQITASDDARITSCGRILRKYKLDELPQLLNVLKGEMSLVGPRPEVPRYVAEYPEDVKEIVLSVPPGITDYASVYFRDENELLACTGENDQAEDPEKKYIDQILPVKLDYYKEYASNRNLLMDIRIIMLTIKCIFLKW